MVHLGVGAFARAHPIWHTDVAGDGWGVAAFTGRSAAVADRLEAQDGLYTLVVRGAEADDPQVVTAITEAYAGTDLASWRRLLASPSVAVVTITVTEAGYHRDARGGLDLADPRVAADLAALRADPLGEVTTAPGKLVAGLLGRRAAGAGPIALVSCDNVAGNGEMLRRVVRGAAAAVDPTLEGWVAETVAFPTTMVDRITPQTTEDDRAGLARATGVDDPALVVTEPFAEWVLSGDFPAGRPAWEAAGARFVADVAPYETRKLWLLNGAHSLMAYAAPLRGHRTVAEAMADPVVRGWVEDWWRLAAPHVPLPAEETDGYRAALADRFANARIRHQLAQIAADGSQKLPIRILPVLRAELAAGRTPAAACRVLAAWVCHLRGRGVPVNDVDAVRLQPLVSDSIPETVAAVLGTLGVPEVVAQVAGQVAELERQTSTSWSRI
jgi:fructuronate reductase